MHRSVIAIQQKFNNLDIHTNTLQAHAQDHITEENFLKALIIDQWRHHFKFTQDIYLADEFNSKIACKHLPLRFYKHLFFCQFLPHRQNTQISKITYGMPAFDWGWVLVSHPAIERWHVYISALFLMPCFVLFVHFMLFLFLLILCCIWD